MLPSIIITDDHTLFREGLAFLLQTSNRFSQILQASNGKECIELLENNNVDVVLMDIEMPVLDGISATKIITETYECVKIIALSMYGNETYYSKMIDSGAKGFLIKNSAFEVVLQAISEVINGNNYFSPEILDNIIKNLYKTQKKPITEIELTEREIEILFNICKGLNNNEIADCLCISKRTVDKHRENLLSKTQSKNTAGLVIYPIKQGIFNV